MGKSSKPVRIAIPPQMGTWPKIKALVDQGHQIEVVPDLERYDLVLGPNCWLMTSKHEPYLLSHVLPAARKAADLRKKRAPSE